MHSGIKPYVCDICENAYVDLSALIRHRRTHTGEKPYHCDVCNKSFTQSSNFVFHKRIHSGERPYLCDICGKTFVRSCDLLCHKRTHTGEKPYTCETCNKSFSKSSSLVDHERTHSGHKPYECDTCGKSFVTSSHLVTHRRVHTGEKPYKCDICEKKFTTSSALVCHKRIHSGDKPYQCDLCEKRFCQLSHVWSHKKRNHGVQPYKCDICGESFTLSSHLVQHKQTHAQESPLLCHICRKAFPDSTTLACHERTHKEEELQFDNTLVMSGPSSEACDFKRHAGTEFEETAYQNMKSDGDTGTPSMVKRQSPFLQSYVAENAQPHQPHSSEVENTEYTEKTCVCSQCHSGFPSQLKLKNHICDKTFNSFSPLEQKISELIQKNSAKFELAIGKQNELQGTSIETTRHDSDSHSQVNLGKHNGRCDEIFWKSRVLYDENENRSSTCNELETSQGCSDTTFVCSQCSSCYNSLSLLEKHHCIERNICKKEYHISNEQCMYSKGKQDSSPMERCVGDVVGITCVCSLCGCYFHSQSLLDEHVLYSHGFKGEGTA